MSKYSDTKPLYCLFTIAFFGIGFVMFAILSSQIPGDLGSGMQSGTFEAIIGLIGGIFTACFALLYLRSFIAAKKS